MGNKFQFGHLADDNVDSIVERMVEMFRGKKIVSASMVLSDRRTPKIEVSAGPLKNDWTEGRTQLILVSRADPKDPHPSCTITFSCGGYVYTFLSHLKTDVHKPDRPVPYFAFDGWRDLRVQDANSDGDIFLHTFSVTSDLENDAAYYPQRLLKGHFDEPDGLKWSCDRCWQEYSCYDVPALSGFDKKQRDLERRGMNPGAPTVRVCERCAEGSVKAAPSGMNKSNDVGRTSQ